MKHLVFLTLLSFVFSACQTDEQLDETKNDLYIQPTSISGYDKEWWSDVLEKCVQSPTQWCADGCKPCTEPPETGADVWDDFLDAVATSDSAVSDFFKYEAYDEIWSNLDDDFPTVVADLQDGDARIVDVYNSTIPLTFYLVGPSTDTDTEIRSSPDLTLYVY